MVNRLELKIEMMYFEHRMKATQTIAISQGFIQFAQYRKQVLKIKIRKNVQTHHRTWRVCVRTNVLRFIDAHAVIHVLIFYLKK